MELTTATPRPKNEVALISPVVREFHPEPHKLDRFFQEMLLVMQMTEEWKLSLPLMHLINLRNIPMAGRLAAVEVGESVEELKAGNHNKFAAEWIDTVTVTSAWISTILSLDLKTDVFRHVNGQGRDSKVFKRAAEISNNFPSALEKLNKDVAEYLKLMFSGLIHAPRFSANLVGLAVDKLQDNQLNYPQELFGIVDAHGKTLSPEAQELKYNHVLRCLKWLRSLQPGRILPEDWRAVKDQILAFQSSDEAFSMLQTRWFELHPDALTVLSTVA